MRVVFDQEKHRSEELVSKRWGVLGVGIAYWKVIINMNVRVNGDKDFGNTCWIALSCPRCSFLLLCLNLSSYLCFCHWKKCPRANACLYVCVHIYSWLPAFPSLGNWWFSKVFQSTAVWDTPCFLSVHPRGASFFEPPFLVLLVGLACGWVWEQEYWKWAASCWLCWSWGRWYGSKYGCVSVKGGSLFLCHSSP